MTPETMQSMNMWLAIIAFVSVGELVILLAVGFLCYRLYSRTMHEIDHVENRYIAPLSAKATSVLNDAHEMTKRVRDADDAVRDVVARVDETAERIAAQARRRTWPLVGAWRAVRAGVATMFGRA